MPKPNFLIVGTARAATTTLYYTLREHPEVFLAHVKEPCFFNQSPEKVEEELSDYLKFFSDVKDEKIIGEASTVYLYSQQAPKNISKYIGTPKIFIQLREPLDRAVSQYRHMKRIGEEPLSFKEALEKEEERIRRNYSADYHYFHRGLYYSQVQSYMNLFPRDNIKVTLFENFKERPKRVLKDITRFLGIGDELLPEEVRKYNQGTQLRVPAIRNFFTGNSLLKKFIKFITPDKPRKVIANKVRVGLNPSSEKIEVELSSEEKRVLKERYKEDIEKLETLIDKKLDVWKRNNRQGL